MADERTAVYRLRDEAGSLLYVGITNCPERRFKQHEREKEWWGDVERHDIRWYATRDEAAAVEAAAIEHEVPIHNKTHHSVFRRLLGVLGDQDVKEALSVLPPCIHGYSDCPHLGYRSVLSSEGYDCEREERGPIVVVDGEMHYSHASGELCPVDLTGVAQTLNELPAVIDYVLSRTQKLVAFTQNLLAETGAEWRHPDVLDSRERARCDRLRNEWVAFIEAQGLSTDGLSTWWPDRILAEAGIGPGDFLDAADDTGGYRHIPSVGNKVDDRLREWRQALISVSGEDAT